MKYTDQQNLAIEDQNKKFDDLMVKINNGVKKIGIFGPAGVGKTHMASKLIREIAYKHEQQFGYPPTVLCSALSHQACGVMENMLEDMGTDGIEYEVKTLASSLHHKKHVNEDGVVSFKYQEKKIFQNGRFVVIPPPIAECDILISDECSQLNENQINSIDYFISPSAYQIYLGDICQLPPIEKIPGQIVSPIFDIDHVTLSIPFRYEGDLQDLANANREQILLALEGKKYDINFWKDFTSHKNKDYIFTNNKLEFLNYLIIHNKGNTNPYHVKFICYHNLTHERTSKFIRNKINKQQFDYEPGDLIMATNTYTPDNIKSVLINSEHAFIERKAKLTTKVVFLRHFNDYCYYGIEKNLTDDVQIKEYYSNLFNTDVEVYDMPYFAIKVEGKREWIPINPMYKNQVEEWCKNILAGKFYDREDFEGNKWIAMYDLKNFFAEISYGYGSSSHKAQGINVDAAGIHLADIMNNKHTTPLEKMQSLYVAITRARYKNYIFYE